MKKIIDELINSSISGVDVYRYKNATWLIFTNEVRWVVELTDEGTLWYNYKFFNDIFKYVSMTVGKEMEEYVIGWANDFFYKDCIHRTAAYPMDTNRNRIPKVLENGIKEVYDSSATHRQMRAQNLMGRIVKDAKPHRVVVPAQGMDRFYYDPGCSANTTDIWMVVEEGIKNIYPDQNSGDYDWSDEFEAGKVIDGGIKVIPLPDVSGELRGYGDYYNTKEDRTKPHTEYVKDAIDGGTKL
jgi:hypothetical protein